MRLSWVGSLAVLGATIVGCIDLFHSTDFDNLCAVDASACADASVDVVPPDEAGSDMDVVVTTDGGPDAPLDAHVGPTDFCTWDPTTAHENARHACAWLGACAAPFGGNAFGTCFDRALLAYDCKLNPNRRVIGRAHELWDCLWQATSCDAVMACVFPDRPQPCDSDAGQFGEFSACGGGASGFEQNASTRMDCAQPGAPTGAEPCVAGGQTCTVGTCSGKAAACTATQCEGTFLRDCVDAGNGEIDDVGVDCALYGAGACVMDDGGVPSCVATGGESCTRTTNVSCTADGRAIGCPSGVEETIDCRNLMEDAGTCSATGVGRPWDVARGCVPNDNAGCTEDCLGDGGLLACHRGKAVPIACGSYGLKECRRVSNLLIQHPACTPP